MVTKFQRRHLGHSPPQFHLTDDLHQYMTLNIYSLYNYLEPQMLQLLYTTLIRPHLDYACVI